MTRPGASREQWTVTGSHQGFCATISPRLSEVAGYVVELIMTYGLQYLASESATANVLSCITVVMGYCQPRCLEIAHNSLTSQDKYG